MNLDQHPVDSARGIRSPVQLWWDLQHRLGWWTRRLSADDERLRYEALGEAVGGAGKSSTVLDLGCGHGFLTEFLAPRTRALYTGVDFSPAAVAAGRQAYEHSGARFIAADLRLWSPPAKVDTIVFNEVLYYFVRPATLVRRYLRWLSPDGCLLVAMYHASFRRAPISRLIIDRIWRTLEREFELLNSWSVRDTTGQLVGRIAQLKPSGHERSVATACRPGRPARESSLNADARLDNASR